MPANPNWARWIYASAAYYLKVIAQDNQLPCIVEGLDDRTKAYMASTDRMEIRINGPYVQEISTGYFRVFADINVLLSSRMDEQKGGYALQRFAGIMQAAMSDQIAIWNYGDQAGDFDDDDPDTQIHIGCLSPLPGKNDTIKVLHFGQVEKTDRIKQAAVDARYQMYLDTSCPSLYSPSPVSPSPCASAASLDNRYEAETDDATLIGAPVYVKSNTHVGLASSSGAGISTVAGLATEAVQAHLPVHYTTDGEVVRTNWTAITGSTLLTPGMTYYLGSTPGTLTSTPPTSGYLVIVGVAINATTLDVEISVPVHL